MLYGIFICDRHFRILACFDHFLCLLAAGSLYPENESQDLCTWLLYLRKCILFPLLQASQSWLFPAPGRSVYRHIISHGISPLFLFSILFICAFYSGSRRIRCRPGDLKVKSTRHCIQIQNLSAKCNPFTSLDSIVPGSTSLILIPPFVMIASVISQTCKRTLKILDQSDESQTFFFCDHIDFLFRIDPAQFDHNRNQF